MLEQRFASRRACGAPALPDRQAPGHLAVIAPHPDDEVIGCGGLVSSCVAAGSRVSVLFLTVEAERSLVKPTSRAGGDRRLAECADAQRVLGYHARAHLALPERGLSSREAELADRIGVWLADLQADRLLLPNPDDAHPDHAAAARAAGVALSGLFAGSTSRAPELWLYEVWGPVRADVVAPLDAAARARRGAALDCYASQLESLDYHAVMDAIAQAAAVAAGLAPGSHAECFERLPASAWRPRLTSAGSTRAH